MIPARIGLAPSSVTVLAVVAANKAVSPAMLRTPGAAMTLCEMLSTQSPLVLQEPPPAEFHCACPEMVTPAVAVTPPLTACTVAEPLA